MSAGLSLRDRAVITLGLVLLPAVVLALVWTFAHDRALRTLKIETAQRSAAFAAAQVDAIFRETELAGSSLHADLASNQAESRVTCAGPLAGLIGANSAYSAAALYAGDHVLCSAGAAAADIEAVVTPERLKALHQQLDGGGRPAVLPPEDHSPHFVIGIGLGDRSDLTLVILAVDTLLDGPLGVDRIDLEHGAALLSRSGQILADWHSPEIRGRWLPADPATLHATVLPAGTAADSQSGERFRYFLAAADKMGLRVLVGYPEASLFATERNLFWSALAPPFLMLAAAAAGAIWAVERLVVKWVNYLQRVTRLYGSGRFSVRAIRLRGAPRELAELGNAFNSMAQNIAEHANALEKAAQEKSDLLRELHHRVKNNFQVIVSLLSLHKQTQPGDRREDIRFIEDHVQAMAVAYRVGYASGDMAEAPLAELVHDTVDGLRRSAGLGPGRVLVEVPPTVASIDLDRGIGVGLYLAAMLPAYLDEARAANLDVKVVALQNDGGVRLAVSIKPPTIVVQLSFLRSRLTRAYIRQLAARELVPGDISERAIQIPLSGEAARPFA